MPRIFVSFSGDLGRAVGVAIYEWLGRVALADLWLAQRDLRAGDVWIDTLAGELRRTDRAILCVTRDSLRAPWIHFEAGAAFKGLGAGQIVPYLLDFSPKRLTEPLRVFQAVSADREGTLKLFKALDLVVPPEVFDREWPRLNHQLMRLRRKSRRRRYRLLVGLVILVLSLVVYGWWLKSTGLFPDFEPALENLNTANAAPLVVRYHPCAYRSANCPRGYYHSFDAALSGGYATLSFDRLRWLPISLQGRQVLSALTFRAGNQTLELGIADTVGNTAFFDCHSDSATVVFRASLNPKELLNRRCRLNVDSVRSFSIGYASAAGNGNHGFDLYHLSLRPDDAALQVQTTPCELRRCAE